VAKKSADKPTSAKDPVSKPKPARKPRAREAYQSLSESQESETYILFGTSSQLTRDESPEFFRSLQQAMKESEESQVDNAVDMNDSTSRGVDIVRMGSVVLRKGRGLWAASARDDEEGLTSVKQPPINVPPEDHAKPTNPTSALDSLPTQLESPPFGNDFVPMPPRECTPIPYSEASHDDSGFMSFDCPADEPGPKRISAGCEGGECSAPPLPEAPPTHL